jgi:hypothetical protein
VAQFKRGDFSTCDVPRPGRSKTVTTPEIIDQIQELTLEDLVMFTATSQEMRILASFVIIFGKFLAYCYQR